MQMQSILASKSEAKAFGQTLRNSLQEMLLLKHLASKSDRQGFALLGLRPAYLHNHLQLQLGRGFAPTTPIFNIQGLRAAGPGATLCYQARARNTRAVRVTTT